MTSPFTLEHAKIGDRLRVIAITDPETATNALRLGVAEGEILEIASKIPGGPVVIRRGGMEIALGRELCRSIHVEKNNGIPQ
jgi:ferrous iron transport protein A